MSPELEKESLLRVLSDGIFVCSKEGDLLFSNPAFSRILGYSEKEIAGKNLGKDLVERSLEWKALLSLLEQGGRVEDYEIRFKRKDGGTASAAVSASSFREARGPLIGYAVVVRDITTRKGVENELREKSFRIDTMNKIAKLIASEIEVKRHALLGASNELRKLIDFDMLILGLTEENGRHVEVVMPDEKSPGSARSLGKVRYDGSLVEMLRSGRSPVITSRKEAQETFTEFSVVELGPVQSLLSVPLSSRGRILGSLTVGHQKPDAYNLETAELLRMVADQVASLIDNMILLSSLEARIGLQDALLRSGVELQKAISKEQIYAAISKSIKEVIDFTELSFYLVDWSHGMIYPVYAAGQSANEVMASAGTVDEGVVGAVAKTGKAEFTDDVDSDPRVAQIPGLPSEHNSMLAIPLFGAEGVTGVLELYRPKGQVFTVTELEAGKLFAQQASVALENSHLVSILQEAKKEIELLNDLMFHDINNFNFATLNYLQMIADEPGISSEGRSHVEKSLHLIRQTAELIDSVKKLTKIGVMDLKDFATIDLVGVLEKIASGIEKASPGKRVSINLRLPYSIPVTANRLVEEIFLNLISNAVKYDPHSDVEIDVDCVKTLEAGKPLWRICVADHGNGVPDDKKGLLFQKYLRLKPESEIGGTGLGLSICRALTDKFGGRIWVEDRVPRKSELGAKFCVVLPAAKDGP